LIARLLTGALRTVYGIFALGVFTGLLLLAAALTLFTPGLERRRRMVRGFARLGLAVLRIRLSVVGQENLPAGSCIVVANHSSYLDGVILKASLPPRFSFVIKREAASTPLLGTLLKRIGSEFLDRSANGGRQRDALRVLRKAEAGHSLVFFPEGTFVTAPGLQRFHAGAFVAASRARLPVVPVIILGARRALPNRSIITRPGPVQVRILQPLALGDVGGSVNSLRDESRARILAGLDEPDVARG
jgi:1-acyl-sn-glycerol-3-phosphate acyltransferase